MKNIEFEQNHYAGLDVLRAVAAFGIVGQHIELFPRTWLGTVLTNYTDLNVGVFGAVSGFLLCRSISASISADKQGLLKLIRRRCSRLVVVYLVWTIIYLAFSCLFSAFFKCEGLNPKMYKIGFWVDSLLFGGASCHLWYLICLFYLTCILVAWAKLCHPSRWPSSLWFGFSVLLLWLATGFGHGWTQYYFMRLACYVVLGCAVFLSSRALQQINLKAVLVALFVAIVCRTALAGRWPNFYLEYLCVLPMLILALRWPAKLCPNRVVQSMYDASFAVYLVHPIFAAGFGWFVARLVPRPYPVWAIMADWLLVYGVSFFFGMGMRRSSIGKTITG